jgi:hypothetical protein
VVRRDKKSIKTQFYELELAQKFIFQNRLKYWFYVW